MVCHCCKNCDVDADCYYYVLGGGPCDGVDLPIYYPATTEGLDAAIAYGDQLIANGCTGTISVDEGYGKCCNNRCYPAEADLPVYVPQPVVCP